MTWRVGAEAWQRLEEQSWNLFKELGYVPAT
jgi:hypothetical protein